MKLIEKKNVIGIAIAIIVTITVLFVLVFPASATDAPADISFTVGKSTKMSGNLFTNKWGVNSADVDLRELIHGYNTVAWEKNGDYEIDTTVIRQLDAYNENGNKRYRIALNEGLAYNDGTPITAWDYAFSALLMSSEEFSALGGAPTEMSWLLGYDAFVDGWPFEGVRVIDDYTLDITIDGRFLPYFYEIMLLSITPYPIGLLAPDCEVKDDGQGAYIEGPFTVNLLRASVMDEKTGYLHNPTVTAGPYMLVSFDGDSQIAQFKKNPYYAGNFEGVVPQIETLTVVFTDPLTALDDIERGKIDLVNNVSSGEVIADGMNRSGEGRLRMESYLRSGMTFVSFSCELGPTQSVNVRRAVALCVDRQEVSRSFTQDNGIPVYAYYGAGQWMAQKAADALAAFETGFDLDEAAWLLVEDGWVLDRNGDPYNEDIGGARYREAEDSTLEKLSLKWAQPQETALSDLLEQAMRTKLESIGIEVEVKKLPFHELLAHYYRQIDREYNMFTLTTGFNLAFDPYFTFHTGDEFQGESNRTGLRDDDLMALARAMRETQVQDNETYMERWLEFQDRFTELHPMVPLFSNVSFDFFRTDLQQYFANAYFSWATAIVYAYIGEEPLFEEGDEVQGSWLDDIGW